MVKSFMFSNSFNHIEYQIRAYNSQKKKN